MTPPGVGGVSALFLDPVNQAEKLSGKETVYRMWQTMIDLEPVFTSEFTLPDGTVLSRP